LEKICGRAVSSFRAFSKFEFKFFSRREYSLDDYERGRGKNYVDRTYLFAVRALFRISRRELDRSFYAVRREILITTASN